MESVIGEYSSYQAALCAHNLEGHVIALWANTSDTENYAFSQLKDSDVDSPTNFICLCTSSRADVAIIRDGSFGEKQKDGDGPAEAAPGNAGIVSIGKTHFALMRSRTAALHRGNVSRCVSLFVLGQQIATEPHAVSVLLEKQSRALHGQTSAQKCRLSDSTRHSLFIRGYKYDKPGQRWS